MQSCEDLSFEDGYANLGVVLKSVCFPYQQTPGGGHDRMLVYHGHSPEPGDECHVGNPG